MPSKPKHGDVKYRHPDHYEVVYFAGGEWHWFMSLPSKDQAETEKIRLDLALKRIIREKTGVKS